MATATTSTIRDAVTATIHAVLAPYPIEANNIDAALAVLFGDETKIPKTMSIGEAAELLRCSKQTVHNLIRRKAIRRASVPGMSRGRGVVADDVRIIVEGKAVGLVAESETKGA